MPKSKQPPKQTNRFWRFLKKRPKTSIVLAIVLVLALGFSISQEVEQQRQAHKLRIADEKLQDFADNIEKIDQNIKFERTTSCKHNERKFSSGPLVCESRLSVQKEYAAQGDLDAAILASIDSLNRQTILRDLDFSLHKDHVRYKLASGSVVDINLNYVNTDLDRSLAGEFSLSLYTSEKVHRPIYKYTE